MCVGKFLLIILLFSSTAFGQCTNPIRVGVNSEWPPYISIENDHISGLDMAIITLLLESIVVFMKTKVFAEKNDGV